MTLSKRDTVVLVDFSGLAWTCWEPALSAQEASQAALAAHQATCASCELEEPCPTKPRVYDAKRVLLDNIDLKFGTLAEAIDTSVKTWVMVKDGQDKRRRELWPAYKANREKKPFDPRPLAEEHIRKKGCRFCWSPEAEADDAIATMAKVLAEGVVGPTIDIPAKDVVIVSSDKDLWQLWDPPRIRIYLTTKKEFLTREYMEKKLRVTEASHVRLVKALWGDPSDNVPNAAPRMQAQLLPIVKNSEGDLKKFWAEAAGNMAPVTRRAHEILTENMEQIFTNWEVVGLYLDVPVVWL